MGIYIDHFWYLHLNKSVQKDIKDSEKLNKDTYRDIKYLKIARSIFFKFSFKKAIKV